MKLIKLTQNKFAKIDDCDFERVSEKKWYYWKSKKRINKCEVRNHFWDKKNKKYHTILLHRFILNPPQGMVVDHINGDSTDNRRSNIRICTNQQNSFNVHAINSNSGYKGVYFDKSKNKYKVSITHNGKKYHLGSFKNPEDGAIAYNKKAIEFFGDFSCLNKI